MTPIYDIAHRYVDDLAALDPITATSLGLPGYERRLPGFSPDGVAAIAALNRRTVAELGAALPEGRPRVGASARRRRL